MRYFTMILAAAAIMIFFVGCAKQNASYIAHAQTIHPIVVPPVDTEVKASENYYPVPNNAPSITTSPSLIPSGSNLQRFDNQSQLQSSKTVLAILQQNSAAPAPVLIIDQKQGQVWGKVGRALQKTPYQILDQDNTINSYYVLDVKSTNNKITKKTPIYRVYLKSDGNRTDVVLLDKDNQPAEKSVSQRILSAIQQQFV